LTEAIERHQCSYRLKRSVLHFLEQLNPQEKGIKTDIDAFQGNRQDEKGVRLVFGLSHRRRLANMFKVRLPITASS
jgi:hypothetical protein